jgi:uncharacterized Zn finger protein
MSCPCCHRDAAVLIPPKELEEPIYKCMDCGLILIPELAGFTAESPER